MPTDMPERRHSPAVMSPDEANAVAEQAAENEHSVPEAVAAAVKPMLRGWIHLVTTPLALISGLVLLVLTPTVHARIGVAVFVLAAVVLFGTSAIYHRGTWSPQLFAMLRRMDHSNIFLLIAGTYTPLAVILLEGNTATLLLSVIWGGAAIGIVSRMLWLGAPRWVYVPLYILLGWVAVWFLPDFWTVGGPAVVLLVAAGGLAYTLGATAYAIKRPNPSPDWFGFHEIFHVGTVVGWGCHFAAVAVAVARLA
ncbi:PAQR family membrane homeostasis protein TrhA [Bogoriella caseilytica]|uniref:Channel protein (Hemolysin III family) n=1 Tax=Bogoriella caseilytica TaxID=56055 RepID=A0A3N2BAB1_9MICO|nr:channel protein (hemolysin III family) [Bogoriella caseilytica]